MTDDVSVVVCAHDEGRWNAIGQALRSISAQRVSAREVVVVVDHNDRLLERIRAELGVRAVPNTGVRGLHGARNSGIKATAGAIVAFLDDDATVGPDWLAQLTAEYAADPDVAGVGGGAEPLWEEARPSWFPPEFDWVVGCSYRGMPETTREVRNLFGCNMSFRREPLEALDGFRIGYSCDETEFCIRLRQRWPDRKLIYLPQARIAHYVPASRTGFRRFLWRCYFEGGSKAVVARLVGRAEGLASEYHYTRRVLPRAVARGLADFVRRGDRSGLARAAVIVAGWLSTAAGYLVGHLTFKRSARRRGFVGEL